MNVAIIGAGVSGLACAKELNRFGIIPAIYEIRDKTGLSYMHSMAILNIYHNNRDPLDLLNSKYNVDIKPLGRIKCVEMHSTHKSAKVKGNLGYYFLRGESEASVINQLARCVKAKINHNAVADIEKIKKDYDYVVVATGEETIPKKMGIWEEIITTWTRGAVVIGEVPDYTLKVWFKISDTGLGYACQLPIDNNKGTIFFVLPYANKEETEYYWQRFLFDNRIEYNILYNFEQKVNAGKLTSHVVDNILFAGNSGGFLDPFLGFGFYNAVATGTLAARAIAGKINYEKETAGFQKQQDDLAAIRRAYDCLEDKDIDKIVSAVNTYPLNHMIYSGHFNGIKLLSLLVRVFYNGDNQNNQRH